MSMMLRCFTARYAVAEGTGQRDVSNYHRPTTGNRDVTTICSVRRTDDVIAKRTCQQRNVATKRLRLRHQQTWVVPWPSK